MRQGVQSACSILIVVLCMTAESKIDQSDGLLELRMKKSEKQEAHVKRIRIEGDKCNRALRFVSLRSQLPARNKGSGIPGLHMLCASVNYDKGYRLVAHRNLVLPVRSP